jgi:2,3-bisphosphoglycerate-independent phosphoglycerate mutase
MKHIVILGDGMADYKISKLGNKTPLEYTKKPNIDFLSKNGELGLVKTVPDSFSPGSDVANLSVMGYNPKEYYSGRSPLEAVSMGIELNPNDTALRCNLVTLSNKENYDNKTIEDHSSDEITTEEAHELIEEIADKLNNKFLKFYKGISYRHCLVWNNCNETFDLTPPHDILEKSIKNYLPKGSKGNLIYDLMYKSYEILNNHPINIKRISKGLRPANSIWLWGAGKKAQLPLFENKYKLKGSVISAVDLIKGIALCSGLQSIDVKNATGTLNTNYKGKAQATLKSLDAGNDFVYVHIEAPDECSHRGELENKIKAIELIDKNIVGPIIKGLEKYDNYKIMVLPDHPTPISIRTHTNDAVPYIIYEKNSHKKSKLSYNEFTAKDTGIYIDMGHKLMDKFIEIH